MKFLRVEVHTGSERTIKFDSKKKKKKKKELGDTTAAVGTWNAITLRSCDFEVYALKPSQLPAQYFS
jgi:hypothetical protein